MKTIINLGGIPLVNNLKNAKEEALNATRYPLEVIEDKNLMMRLNIAVDIKKL